MAMIVQGLNRVDSPEVQAQKLKSGAVINLMQGSDLARPDVGDALNRSEPSAILGGGNKVVGVNRSAAEAIRLAQTHGVDPETAQLASTYAHGAERAGLAEQPEAEPEIPKSKPAADLNDQLEKLGLITSEAIAVGTDLEEEHSAAAKGGKLVHEALASLDQHEDPWAALRELGKAGIPLDAQHDLETAHADQHTEQPIAQSTPSFLRSDSEVALAQASQQHSASVTPAPIIDLTAHLTNQVGEERKSRLSELQAA